MEILFTYMAQMFHSPCVSVGTPFFTSEVSARQRGLVVLILKNCFLKVVNLQQ